MNTAKRILGGIGSGYLVLHGLAVIYAVTASPSDVRSQSESIRTLFYSFGGVIEIFTGILTLRSLVAKK